jgi:hypothetical protein
MLEYRVADHEIKFIVAEFAEVTSVPDPKLHQV